jgi:hypothetical protein
MPFAKTRNQTVFIEQHKKRPNQLSFTFAAPLSFGCNRSVLTIPLPLSISWPTFTFADCLVNAFVSLNLPPFTVFRWFVGFRCECVCQPADSNPDAINVMTAAHSASAYPPDGLRQSNPSSSIASTSASLSIQQCDHQHQLFPSNHGWLSVISEPTTNFVARERKVMTADQTKAPAISNSAAKFGSPFVTDRTTLVIAKHRSIVRLSTRHSKSTIDRVVLFRRSFVFRTTSDLMLTNRTKPCRHGTRDSCFMASNCCQS